MRSHPLQQIAYGSVAKMPFNSPHHKGIISTVLVAHSSLLLVATKTTVPNLFFALARKIY